jgi:hypothetical protein
MPPQPALDLSPSDHPRPPLDRALRATAIATALLGLLSACGSITPGRHRSPNTTGGQTNPVCAAGASAGPVQAPVFVRNLNPGQTGWFASPLVADLDGTGSKKIVAALYSLFVYDATGHLLDRADGNGQRIFAPHVVTDLDGDGIQDIVAGQGHQVFAYEWRNGKLSLKQGWPVDTTTASEQPEVRGLAAADLELDGTLEVVATTTQTKRTAQGGAQVFVFASTGALFQPAGTPFQAWPRYNARTGAANGGDLDRNGAGMDGYGCYALNVGIGNLDDDPRPEIVVTYDNHFIEVFHADGESLNASPWFTNRSSGFVGEPLAWGQFIRWADPAVDEAQWHLHTGAWPSPDQEEWLQWTTSPPNVVDLNGDGKAVVVGVPNVEKQIPYQTQAFAVMALEGAWGDGSRSAMRVPGWEELPRGEVPLLPAGDYPPHGVPAAATVDIQGDARSEIVVSLDDGYLYAFDASGDRLWRYDYTEGKAMMFASEVTIADLNQDGSPEIVFTTFGDPEVTDSGHLIILAANGALLHDVPLPHPGHNGNGNGAPAAPTIAALDATGQLSILVQTFDHGLDVFTVPGSGDRCLLWSTARGGPLRTGAPSGP